MAPETVSYTVTVVGFDGAESIHSDVGGTTVVPSTPPVLVLLDTKGRNKAVITLSAGMVCTYDALVTPAVLTPMQKLVVV